MKTPAAAARRKTAPDAIALLKDDHRAVCALFDEFDKLVDSKAKAKKLKLARKICTELKIHTRIEEEIFYPGVNAVLPKEQDLRELGMRLAFRKAELARAAK